VFNRTYGLNYIGLRYFNIFGPKQNPNNPYAAVIPLFCKAFIEGKAPLIFGDGETSRDFTYVDNAVLANELALFTQNNVALNQVYNAACGDQVSLNKMVEVLNALTGKKLKVNYSKERLGDVRHSKADINKIRQLLGYHPRVKFEEGLRQAFLWYSNNYTIM
jgi:UDP-N-acetylglucosamine 4-epimerase